MQSWKVVRGEPRTWMSCAKPSSRYRTHNRSSHFCPYPCTSRASKAMYSVLTCTFHWIFGALRHILLPHDPIALTHWGTSKRITRHPRLVPLGDTGRIIVGWRPFPGLTRNALQIFFPHGTAWLRLCGGYYAKDLMITLHLVWTYDLMAVLYNIIQHMYVVGRCAE